MESTSDKASRVFLKNPVFKSHGLCVLILIFSAAGCYHLSLRLISQIHYQKAMTASREGHGELAAMHLERAAHHQPADYKIQKELGRVWSESGALEKNPWKAFLLAQKSRDFYLEAFKLNPLDAESAYGLATGEARLEDAYQRLHPKMKMTPFRPLFHFKQAIRLRPHGITYNYALARHLHKKRDEDALFRVVRNLVRICPHAYHHLRKEAFWSPRVKEACKTGLQEAVREKVSPRDALAILSSISAGEKDWATAISHYRASLDHKRFQNDSGNYIHLGHLLLKNGEFEEAEKIFFHALDMSRSVENHLEHLHRLYKREYELERFHSFCQTFSRRFIMYAFQTDILMARSLIDLKRYAEAKEALGDLNRKSPSGEAYYWLAHIAQTERDWDSMELAIQKATVLDPANSQYHLTFSTVLKRLKKLERAEREAGLAIRHLERPTCSFFNHRAWIRWGKEDYFGAAEDWESAIALNPNRADFHAHAAEAYWKMGNLSQARAYYQRAVILAPNNAHYSRKYLEIKEQEKGRNLG